jgi:RNA polymerase sigma-70 factor (ECF subfamily)
MRNQSYLFMNDLFNKNFNILAEKLSQGDKKAGEEIFNYFGVKIFRYFMVRLANREAAEDLTQEVFIKLVAKIKTFNRQIGDFSNWLWRIAKNTLTDYFRQRKTINFSDLNFAPEKTISYEERYIEKLSQEYQFKKVLKLIQNFSQEEQEIFSLHYLSGLSYKKLSQLTGKSAGALRITVHRINKKIKKAICD